MKIFYNYFVTGGAAIFFFILALFDLLLREPNNPHYDSWQYMSLFGKIDTILCVGLFVWTVGCILIRGKWN
jgi:uncharacterized membrane protein